MQWSTDLIGQCSVPKTHHIQRGVVEQFARALDLTYPIYFDSEAAKAAGFQNVIAPPTFAFTLTADAIPGLDLPEAGIIHGEQEITSYHPITAGDEIQVIQCVENVKERGSAVFLTLKTTGNNRSGEMMFMSRSVLIVNRDQGRNQGGDR